MIYVAAIQNIPSEILEAADIDGAKGFTKLWRIILPMILPAITINLFLTLINAFKQFDINFALNNGGPGMMFNGTPVMGSELLALNIYNTAFSFSNMALAQVAILAIALRNSLATPPPRCEKTRNLNASIASLDLWPNVR